MVRRERNNQRHRPVNGERGVFRLAAFDGGQKFAVHDKEINVSVGLLCVACVLAKPDNLIFAAVGSWIDVEVARHHCGPLLSDALAKYVPECL